MIRIGIDIGGTFTDFAVWKGDGEGYTSIESFKVLSTPSNYADAVVQGIERIIETGLIDPGEPVALMHGTTVSTNAVIERMAPRIALFTTDGFIDLLNIQRLRLKHPPILFSGRVQPLLPREDVFEINEHRGADGRVASPEEHTSEL